MWNAANVARACRAILAGLAFVILSASLAGAVFGPRTTIGNNYQQWSSEESPDGINPGNCVGTQCYVRFQRTPQQRPLIVQHVSCLVFVGPGDLVYGSVLTRKAQNFRDRRTRLLPVNTNSTAWVVNSPVMHLIKSGERPIVILQASANSGWTLDCTISGKLR